MPRTLDDVRKALTAAKKTRADRSLARLMLKYGRLTDDARAYVSQHYDPHAICRKWVGRLGGSFHPDTRGADYSPALSPDEVKEYDADMESLFKIAADPYECAVAAMADAGFYQ